MIKSMGKEKKSAKHPVPRIKLKTGELFKEEKKEVVEIKKEEPTPIDQQDLLNNQEELFCKLYATDRRFFANGTQSYIEAYGIDIDNGDSYGSARTQASKLLTKSNIIKRINELLELDSLNDVTVDKKLAFLIEQNAELSVSLNAIKEYNALKDRIKKKLELTGKDGKPLFVATPESLIPKDVRSQIQQGVVGGVEEELMES